MSDFNDYLNKAKDLAEDASEGAKDLAGEVVSKVRELTDDGRKVKELKETAKEQASSLTSGAKEKLQGFFQDAGAGTHRPSERSPSRFINSAYQGVISFIFPLIEPHGFKPLPLTGKPLFIHGTSYLSP